MADFAMQRLNMVESQVRPSDVTDRRIIRAMTQVPREQFVPPDCRSIAYMDGDVPLRSMASQSRYLLAPRTLARLIQLASVEATDRVLVVGCATGYSLAVLAQIGREVVGLEPDARLANAAEAILKSAFVNTVRIVSGPMSGAVAADGAFDVILIEGAVAEMPQSLANQLSEGGRLIAIVREANRPGEAIRVLRTAAGLSVTEAFDATAPYLPGMEPVAAFAL